MTEEKTKKVVLHDLKPVDKKTQQTLDELFGSHALVHGGSATWCHYGGAWHYDVDLPF